MILGIEIKDGFTSLDTFNSVDIVMNLVYMSLKIRVKFTKGIRDT